MTTTDMRYGRILGESDEAYHASGAIGSSQLSEFFNNEALWAGRRDGTFPKREETSALTFGRAFHAYVLEGATVFGERFAVGGPINEKTGRCYGTDTKAYTEWAKAQGKPCLSYEERDKIVLMAQAVKQNAEAVKYLRGLHEVTYRTKLSGLDVQCRCDTINEAEGWISDLKTTESLDKFRRSCISYGYARQASFYRTVAQKVLDKSASALRFVFIAVEKNPPYAVGLYRTSDQLDILSEDQIERALERMKAVMGGAAPKRDPDGIQELSCPEYMLADLELSAAVDEDF